MKKISAETTRYLMDAMAYSFVAATVAATDEEPTDDEIRQHVRVLMALFCRSEKIEPTYYSGTASYGPWRSHCDDYDDYDEYDGYDDGYDEDEDEDEDLDELCEELLNRFKKFNL